MKTITPSRSRTTHAALSHPEAEERGKYWPVNESLRDQLATYKDARADSNQSLGRKLGYPDGTAVSKYLNGKMDRDPSDLESKAADLLRMDARRQTLGTADILDTSVVRQVARFCDVVRAASAVGVLHSPAGLGKTTGIASYAEASPTAVVISA
ncbi:MAG TPA: hypothetical protein PLA50_05075, partial [Bacteroidia bacterium]|nr:hypothetical protein [Bacteroidia bacterium]